MAMSRNNLALALMGIGQQLPEMVRKNREQPLRMSMLENQAKQYDLANKSAEDERSQKKQAQDALAQALDEYANEKLYDKLPETIRNPDYQQKSLRDVAVESGLPKYAGDANVKQFTQDFIKAPEELAAKQNGGGGSGTGGYYAMLKKQATPEDYQKANEMISGFKASGEYDDQTLSSLENFAATNPLLFFQTVGTKRLTTNEGLRGKKEAIPINVENAGKTATARNLAPDRLSDKNTDELTGQQSVYANLDDVKNKFNEKYLTPYIGKGIKMAVLKQNDENFADFQSSLALALNEYRRQNFGTAQTNTEIQNFLDVLNSDLNISPESFQKQLASITNSMERDFNNRVSTKSQQNYAIPENLKKININEDKQTPKPDAHGFTVGQKKFSKKYNRELTYMGNNQWQ